MVANSPTGRALNTAKSRLSRHLSQLEKQLGVRLIRRTSHQLKVTEVVDTIDQPARRAVDEIETARATMEVSSGMLADKVRMTCSVGMGEYALSPSVTRCLKSQPKVEDIQQVTKQTVDLINSGLEIAMKGLTYFEEICHDESGERCP